jgi:Cu/Ag efflux protein CusF
MDNELLKLSKIKLEELRQAKENVKRLEAEYRKVCMCNEPIKGVQLPINSNSYQKTHKTCEYHTYKTYRVMSHADL